MSTRAIQGKNVTLRAKWNDVMIPFACAMSVDVQFDTELISRTSVGAGAYGKYKARRLDWGGEMTSVTNVLPDGTFLTVFNVTMETIRKHGLYVEIEFLDDLGNYQMVSGDVLFPSIGISASMDGFSQDTIAFKGSGVPGVFNAPPPGTENINPVIPGYYEGSNGETGFTDVNIIGKQVILVMRGDPLKIVTTGTPTFQEVKVNNSTGAFLFGVPLGDGERIFYLYQ